MVLVALQHVKHSKEMDDNTQEKDDRKDPIVIARLVPEGRYLIPYIPKDVYAELRAAFHKTEANFWHRLTVHIYRQSYVDIMGYIPYNLSETEV